MIKSFGSTKWGTVTSALTNLGITGGILHKIDRGIGGLAPLNLVGLASLGLPTGTVT